MAGTCDAGFGQRQYLFYRETLKLGVFNAFVSCSEDPALAKPARVSSPVTRWTRPFYPSGNQKRRAPKGQLLEVSWAKHHRLPRRLQQPVRPRQHQRRTPHTGPPSRHAQTAHLLRSGRRDLDRKEISEGIGLAFGAGRGKCRRPIPISWRCGSLTTGSLFSDSAAEPIRRECWLGYCTPLAFCRVAPRTCFPK